METTLRYEIVPLSEVPPENTQSIQKLILVVDDEPLITDTLAKILSHAGYDVRTAYSASDAMCELREAQPDFMLTDVQMPGGDGVELAVHVAKALPACRIVLFSGNASSVDLKRARSAGYEFPLIEKPVHPECLVRYIGGCMSGQPGASGMINVPDVWTWPAMYNRAS